MAVRIGELLLKEKLITPDQLQQALAQQKSNGGKLGFNLVKMGFVKDEQITALLSKQYGVPSINLAQFKLDPTIIKLVPNETARKYQIIPLSRSGSTLTIAMTDPTNVFAMDDIKFMTGYTVEPVVASEIAITEAVEKYYPVGGKGGAGGAGGAAAKGGKPGAPTSTAGMSALEAASKGLEELQTTLGAEDGDVEVLEEMQEISAEALARQGEDAPVVRLVNVVLMSAIQKGASDIHIEPYEKELRVRYRIDGILYNIMSPPMKYRDAISSRIKIMSKLDIAEKRLPQDGRMSLRVAGRPVDVRVSTIPAGHGERVVLRLLDKQAGRLDLGSLGMDPLTQQNMDELIHKPYGIILVTGPTGSGKTTTLYAALERLNDNTSNIMTVEDPIEYYIDGIGQTQVNTKVEMTFARGLRAILRQDPDVVMVGEIRDIETAQIAVQASLTGHLVLSTLHTNTAVGAITRLRDMGVEPFLLSSTLLGVLAQRLVRVLDPDTRVPQPVGAYERKLLNLAPDEPATIYRAGAGNGNGTGYRGRTGIYELVIVDDAMRTLIHDGAGEQEMERHARHATPSIRDDGRRRILAGATTLEEVLRVTRED